jgi:hypothetical protein
MIFFLQFSLNFSDLLIRVLAEKVLDQFLRLCQKSFSAPKIEKEWLFVNTAPGLFGQYSSFLSEIIQIGEGMVGKGRKGFSCFLRLV